MSTIPIHQGQWTDWASGQLLWTTHSSTANLWTNLIAFILGTFVIGACWDVIAFALHRYGDRILPAAEKDGLHRHHRVIWRNVADAFSAFVELLSVGWAWYRTDIPHHLVVGTTMSRKWIILRTCGAMLVPLGLFAGFTAASILAAKIALSGGNVLVKAHSQGQCGFLQYQYGSFLNKSSEPSVLLSYQARALNDTVAGRAYARSCYSQDFASTVSCSFFVQSKLAHSSYQHDESFGCPFGNVNEPFETSPCAVSYNTGAYLMYTDMLDSDLDLGINARPEHRVTFQKNTTCSVINAKPYEVEAKGYDTSPYNFTYQAYCLGPISRTNLSGPCDVSTWTFFYTIAEKYMNVGYTTKSAYSRAPFQYLC